MIGPGKAFDTDRYFVISTNLLGGCRGTTGTVVDRPGDGQAVRSGLPGDHRRGHGDEPSARSWTSSGSSGSRRWPAARSAGMQAFEWAILFPDQVDAVVAIASTHALHPQGVAWNAIAREAIMRDPAWQDGRYYGTGRRARTPAWASRG